MNNIDISDLRCVVCGSTVQADHDQSVCTSLRCCGCGSLYNKAGNVPFLCSYSKEDALGLIEISANIPNIGKFGVTQTAVAEWEVALRQYHESRDKAEIARSHPLVQSPFFLNRYFEWLQFEELTSDIGFQGLKVLDIGAGLGFDSYRLQSRGASVTALEFSPVLANAGKDSFPNIRWIGGMSHCLPFTNESFDAVFCNAALHHMRSIPSAISESLRVLRPGGILITTADSFRSNTSRDEEELLQFDTDTSVLIGVNERAPRIGEFLESLFLNKDLISANLYTHVLSGSVQTGYRSTMTRHSLTECSSLLSKQSGALAMRIQLLKPWNKAALLQLDGELSPSDFAAWMSDLSLAVTRLSDLVPDEYINLPFPGKQRLKFEMLNGWRLPKSLSSSREAYMRGRWFLKRSDDEHQLRFKAALPKDGKSLVTSVRVLLNGQEVGVHPLTSSSFASISVDISHVPAGRTFVVELHQQGGGGLLEEATFLVKEREFVRAASACNDRLSSSKRESFVYAVIPVFNRLHFTRECIRLLKAQDYPCLHIVVSDGGSTDGSVDAIRREFPDVTVLTTETELWWAGSMALGVEHALKESSGENDCVLMMNNDTVFPENYVSTLVATMLQHKAAVGALIVDSRSPERILDAGEYIDWQRYDFPVRSTIDPDERFRDDVDVLPGRGTLVPLYMIRSAGNVDKKMLPHYLADYEFFYRLKQHGYRLGVCYETMILAHIEETGIVPTTGSQSFASVWRELFSRRSMSNVIDHWRFVSRHAPDNQRHRILAKLATRVVVDLTLRTTLRPFFLPLYWFVRLPGAFLRALGYQWRGCIQLARNYRLHGHSAFCYPQDFPLLVRIPLYMLLSPGPIQAEDVSKHGLSVAELVESGVLRSLHAEGWFAFKTLEFRGMTSVAALQALFRESWNPCRKLPKTLALRKDLKSGT